MAVSENGLNRSIVQDNQVGAGRGAQAESGRGEAGSGNQGFRLNPNNLLLGSQEIPTFRCPCDGGRKEWLSPTSEWVLPDGIRGGLARGNYGINCGAGNAFSRTDYRIGRERGLFHFGGSGTPAPGETFAVTFAEVRDGLSNTVWVAELIAA